MKERNWPTFIKSNFRDDPHFLYDTSSTINTPEYCKIETFFWDLNYRSTEGYDNKSHNDFTSVKKAIFVRIL